MGLDSEGVVPVNTSNVKWDEPYVWIQHMGSRRNLFEVERKGRTRFPRGEENNIYALSLRDWLAARNSGLCAGIPRDSLRLRELDLFPRAEDKIRGAHLVVFFQGLDVGEAMIGEEGFQFVEVHPPFVPFQEHGID